MQNKVFISYKNTIDGSHTVDSKMAHELYLALTNAGIPCFFAGKTLQELGSDKYKEQIDSELDHCLIMVVVGTSVENINSRWVRYEWDGFYLDILNGVKNGRVFTYTDRINPHNLPRALRRVQSFDRAKDSLGTVVGFIKNALMDIDGSLETVPAAHIQKQKSYSTSFGFSAVFLQSGATELIDLPASTIREKLQELSELYKPITSLKRYEVSEAFESISDSIYNIIVHGCKSENTKKLLKIKGPLGSYKNRLLQYIYLLLEKEQGTILPFYINLAMYERSKVKFGIGEKEQLELLVKSQFAQIKEIIYREGHKTPLLIIDGIRDFSSGQDWLYSVFKEQIEKTGCHLVVSLDTDFTNNTNHKFSVHPLVGTDFEYFVRISSMSTYNKDGSISFIQKILSIFHINIPYENVDATTIYNRLIKLNVVKLDAYWLENLLTEMLGNILNEELTIADLYEAVCRKHFDTTGIDSAAQLAYEFEYGSIDFSDNDFYFDTRWQILRKHRSVLEYLIARYYIIKLDELDVNSIDNVKKQLHFFNMILPKAVTIFVSPMINRIDAYEAKVLKIASRCYDQMSVFEKNQLIYWMGRLKNKAGIEESITLLKKYKTVQLRQYLEKTEAGNDAKKNAFLLRTISVSLIVLGDREAAASYFNLLLTDKYTNEVNRAFHLTYYGDKPYIPNKSLLDFDDEVNRGSTTFEVLCLSIQKKIDSRTFNYSTILEVFTLCSLLQARIEGASSGQKTIETSKYAVLTQKYLKWLCRQRRITEFDRMHHYFMWMQGELDRYYSLGELYSPASIYNQYSKASKVLRTGWIKRGIPDPENIVEHMYNCWLMAVLYLPEKSTSTKYDKTKILNMLLLHDIAEIKTGDIARSEKVLRQQFYDENENAAMHSFLFSGTYPHAETLAALFATWDNWYYDKDENYLIAKDIDNIQAVYQFCEYYLVHKDLFKEEDAFAWYDSIFEVKTEEGRQVAEKLIVQNPRYQSIIQKFGAQNEYF